MSEDEDEDAGLRDKFSELASACWINEDTCSEEPDYDLHYSECYRDAENVRGMLA